MKLDMKKWCRDLARSKQTMALPIMTYPGLGMVGKTVLDVIRDGREQSECIAALSRAYPSIAAVTVMDLSVEAEAFGAPVHYSETEVPSVSAKIVSDPESVLNLKTPQVGAGRTGVYLETAELAASLIHDRPVFGGHIGPFSLAGRLFDMTEIMVALMLEPDTVHLLLEKVTGFLIKYAQAFKNRGANGIIIAEPAAGLLSPQHCTEFSSAYVQKIITAVQDDHFMVILHNCGNTKNLVPSLLSTGAMGFHFGNAVDMSDILPQIPADRIAFGNVDPARVFKNGSVADIQFQTMELLKKAAAYPNFVLSSGCDIPPGTPLENVTAFFETLERFNTERGRNLPPATVA